MPPDILKNSARFFDGKSVPISEYTPDYETNGITVSAVSAYAQIPYLYKAVHLRSQACARMPFSLHKTGSASQIDLGEQPLYKPLRRAIQDAWYLTEMALCVYGRAYWLPVPNESGRMLYPRWLLPTSIEPRYDMTSGLVGFDRFLNERSFMGNGRRLIERYDPEELVYFWAPSMTAEVGYGVAPVSVAVGAGNVLINLDRFAAHFFGRGAIKATILSIEGNPPKTELDRLESWWRRLVTGVQNAWRSVAVRASVNPVTIGDGLGDIKDNEITERRRQDIAAALQVPYSMLNSNGVNRAVSEQDTENFYDTLIIPETQQLERTTNEQFLSAMGLELRIHPERLEAMQQREVRKAQAIRALTGSQEILTLNEARAMLGYPALPEQEGDPGVLYEYHITTGVMTPDEVRARLGLPPRNDPQEEQRRQLAKALQIVKQAKDAGLNTRIALDLAGLGHMADMIQPAPDVTPEANQEPPDDEKRALKNSQQPDPEIAQLEELLMRVQAIAGASAQPHINTDDVFADPWLIAHAMQPMQPAPEDAPDVTPEANQEPPDDEKERTAADDSGQPQNAPEARTESGDV